MLKKLLATISALALCAALLAPVVYSAPVNSEGGKNPPTVVNHPLPTVVYEVY